jgi:hypothetical protein
MRIKIEHRSPPPKKWPREVMSNCRAKPMRAGVDRLIIIGEIIR